MSGVYYIKQALFVSRGGTKAVDNSVSARGVLLSLPW